MTEQPKIEFAKGRPPNFEEIAKVLPQARRSDTVFTYGNVIYVANGQELPQSIIAHECVHVQQQFLYGRDAWWERYLRDIAFRFQQETAAHQVEYRIMLNDGNRRERRRAEKLIAQRLAGPLYGNACSPMRARALLRESLSTDNTRYINED